MNQSRVFSHAGFACDKEDWHFSETLGFTYFTLEQQLTDLQRSSGETELHETLAAEG